MSFERVTESVFGPDVAIIEGELTVEDCRAIEEAGLHHVVIGSTSDISNLVLIRGLTHLDVLAVELVDLGPVSRLVELKFIGIGGNWHGHISLAELRDLEVFGCMIADRRRSSISGVLPTAKLRYVKGNFREELWTEFAHCQAMRTLFIYPTRQIKNLDWLAGTSQITALGFAGCSFLSDIRGLQHVPSLEYLKFESCRKLGRLDALASLAMLKGLQLDECGNIESLTPLKKLASLQLLSFLGDTRILDGKLSVLESFSDKLSVRFINHPSYDRLASQFSFDDNAFAQLYTKYMNPQIPAVAAWL
jgi:hypothetical protein